MRRKTRTKIKRISIITGLILIIIALAIVIIWLIKLNKKPDISYDDTLTCNNYFEKITIDLNKRKVKRDSFETTLKDEFNITEEKENLLLSSEEELRNFFADSTFRVDFEDNLFKITNEFQTKKIIVEANEIKEQVDGQKIEEVQEGLYLVSFYSQKLTKAMYNYYKDKNYIKNIYLDNVFKVKNIKDESQTLYGQTEEQITHHSRGVSAMGLDNYHKIIYDNGNPSDITISTIGYGVDIQNTFFDGRINDNYYNFILNNKEISETIEQGSRIAEVLADSTTDNVKLMPLVVVNEEGYSTISSIIRAIAYATQNSDVICYELINNKNNAIDLVLENAFKENKPVCSVATSSNQNYPADHAMTIAVSSVDKELQFASYSGQGEYIDFAASSTDIMEIFNSSSTVSRWSGPQYSNAQIVSAIALVKTYNKEATILEIYNFLRNYCQDLGDEGKDTLYGYGLPQFSNLTISDIDKLAPVFYEISFDNEAWEVLKQVKITAKDNIRIDAWAITKEQNGPKEEEWKKLEDVTPELNTTTEITENGTYYIWVKDTAGNTQNQSIQVDKVDNTPPTIAYTIDKNTLSSGYVTINVTAEDAGSGLYDSPFSWDKSTWSQENSKKIVKQNGRYKVYAEDNLGNVSEQEIKVDCFPQQGIYALGDGNIIQNMVVSAEWSGDTNNRVEITLNNESNIVAWQITTFDMVPNNFVELYPERENTNIQNENNTNINGSDIPSNVIVNNSIAVNSNATTQQPSNNVRVNTDPIHITKSLDIKVTYYLWIKDINGNINRQTFTIDKAEV